MTIIGLVGVTPEIAYVTPEVAARLLPVLPPTLRDLILHGRQDKIAVQDAVLKVLLEETDPKPQLPSNFFQSVSTVYTWNISDVIDKFNPGTLVDIYSVERVIDDIMAGDR